MMIWNKKITKEERALGFDGEPHVWDLSTIDTKTDSFFFTFNKDIGEELIFRTYRKGYNRGIKCNLCGREHKRPELILRHLKCNAGGSTIIQSFKSIPDGCFVIKILSNHVDLEKGFDILISWEQKNGMMDSISLHKEIFTIDEEHPSVVIMVDEVDKEEK